MQNGIFFSIISLFYCILTIIIYFSKMKINNEENKIYGKLLIITLFGLLIEIFPSTYVIRVLLTKNYYMSILILKLILVYFIIWTSVFTYYVSLISLKDNNKDYHKFLKKEKIILVGMSIISIILIYFLPLEAYNNNGAACTYGIAANFVYLYSTICIVYWIILLISNIKNILNKKYYPIIMFIILGIIVMMIQYKYPELTLMISMQAFVVCLMYHTIENPDVRMLEELSRRKDINDKVNEGKSNFLFHVTETIKKSIDKVEDISNQALEQETIKEKDECIRDIKYITSNARIKLNETINISIVDARNIKVVGNRYQFHNLIKEINIRTKKSIKGNVEYRSYISADIPDKLYGDSVKVKQILTTILNNAIKHTEKGFIELRINSIQKYDVCRLLITIEDSGHGIDMKTVNDILSSTKDMNIEEIEKIQELNLNLKMVKKLLQVIGGTLNIESNVGVGTTITVTINQKIIEEKKNKEIEKYENMIEKKKKVLVVIENEKNQKQLERLLKKETKLEIVTSSQECLNKIRDKNKYDYLFIQEDMSKIGAKELVKKLYQEEKIDSKIVILREKQELEIMRENIESVDSYLYFPIKKENLRNILEEDK